MSVLTGVLAGAIIILLLINLCQFLVQRAALRIAEILYVITGNVGAQHPAGPGPQ